ncbi:MAG: hypothetical protein JF604_17840 [Bradyrhizobium sp.]|nr:hypothetical protein [Bradyrhizobium sp.]
MSIDLVERCIGLDGRTIGSFSADEMGLEMIAGGMDEFSLTARYLADIKVTQRPLTECWPWLGA